MSYAASITLPFGSSYPSLTLQAQIKDSAGTDVGAAITTGFVNLGNGDYYWRYAAFADGFDGIVVFTSTAGATPAVTMPATVSPADALVPVDSATIAAILAAVDTEIAAIKAKTDLIGSITVTAPGATSRLAAGDNSCPLTFDQGADYRRLLTWRNGLGAPIDLTGWTAILIIWDQQGTVLLELTTENGRITLGGAAGTILLTLSAEVVRALGWIWGVYHLRMIEPSGFRRPPLMRGTVTIEPEPLP